MRVEGLPEGMADPDRGKLRNVMEDTIVLPGLNESKYVRQSIIGATVVSIHNIPESGQSQVYIILKHRNNGVVFALRADNNEESVRIEL